MNQKRILKRTLYVRQNERMSFKTTDTCAKTKEMPDLRGLSHLPGWLSVAAWLGSSAGLPAVADVIVTVILLGLVLLLLLLSTRATNGNTPREAVEQMYPQASVAPSNLLNGSGARGEGGEMMPYVFLARHIARRCVRCSSPKTK